MYPVLAASGNHASTACHLPVAPHAAIDIKDNVDAARHLFAYPAASDISATSTATRIIAHLPRQPPLPTTTTCDQTPPYHPASLLPPATTKDTKEGAGDPFYVLLCCWLAAVGAGLLKTEEILEGVARLRISNDIEFEEETFLDMMKTAKEKRAKLKAPAPEIPMEARVEKALEAIYVCCFGLDMIEEEDVKLLFTMLNAVFPTVGRPAIERIVASMAKQVADGKRRFAGAKAVSKEVVQRQLKDLEFLQQKLDS